MWSKKHEAAHADARPTLNAHHRISLKLLAQIQHQLGEAGVQRHLQHCSGANGSSNGMARLPLTEGCRQQQ
jgi:hypothetical protein